MSVEFKAAQTFDIYLEGRDVVIRNLMGGRGFSVSVVPLKQVLDAQIDTLRNGSGKPDMDLRDAKRAKKILKDALARLSHEIDCKERGR